MTKGSCFNVPFSDDDTYAAWNSLSDQIAELSEHEYLALLHNRPEEIDASRQELLLEKGILVEKTDEMDSFLKQRHMDRQLRSPYFRVLTTTACNARCDYCYEHNFPTLTMDAGTAGSVADFIAQRYREHPLRARVTIEWFGGEPCLNPSPIRIITRRLAEENIPFRSHMTTNGLLLTESLLRNAADWGLRNIQVTLDAANEEYEAIKHVSEGSYAQVLRNIDLCLSSGVRIVIRINYAGNRAQTEALIKSLAERYAKEALRPKVYIAPIYEADKCIPADRMREILALSEQLIGAKLMTFEEVYGLWQRDRCFSATPWGYTILPDGTLVNCSHNVNAENTWGTVWDDSAPNELHQQFLSDKLSEECYTCPLLPVCGGGCSAAQYGVATMHQCIPYKSIITDILRSRLRLGKRHKGKVCDEAAKRSY